MLPPGGQAGQGNEKRGNQKAENMLKDGDQNYGIFVKVLTLF